jgi:hypothetical protein
MFWGTYPYSHPIARRSPDGRDTATVRTAVALASAGYPPAADADYSKPVSPYVARAHARMQTGTRVVYAGTNFWIIKPFGKLGAHEIADYTPDPLLAAIRYLALSPAGASLPVDCDGGAR